MLDITSSQLNNNVRLSNKLFSKYPENREKYTSKVGIYGELYVSEYVEECGYKVKIHLIYEEGADIQTEDNLIGMEVWNWSSPHSYRKRIESVIKNLEPFEYRFLITSFISKEATEEIERAYLGNPIVVIKLNCHIMPEEYLSFYQSKNKTTGKKFSYKEISKILRNTLKPIIAKIEKPEPIVNLMINDRGYVYNTHNNNASSNNIDNVCSAEIRNDKNKVEINNTQASLMNKIENKEALSVHYNRTQFLKKCLFRNRINTGFLNIHELLYRLKRICGDIKLSIKQMLMRTEKLSIRKICMDIKTSLLLNIIKYIRKISITNRVAIEVKNLKWL